MKLIFRLFAVLFLAVLVLAVGILLVKDSLIESRAKAEVEKVTGFPLEIDDLELGLFSSRFVLKGCRLLNPSEFKAREALVIDEISADLNLLSLLTPTVQFKSAVVDIPTLNIETTQEGVNNLELLQQRIKDYADSREPSRSDGRDKPGDKKDRSKKEGKSLYFEVLDIRLGTGAMVDYSKGEEPSVIKVELNLDKHYTNVDSMDEVAIDLTATVIQKTLFGAIGKNFNSLIQDLTEGSPDAGKNLKEEAEKLEDQFKGLLKQFR